MGLMGQLHVHAHIKHGIWQIIIFLDEGIVYMRQVNAGMVPNSPTCKWELYTYSWYTLIYPHMPRQSYCVCVHAALTDFQATSGAAWLVRLDWYPHLQHTFTQYT